MYIIVITLSIISVIILYSKINNSLNKTIKMNVFDKIDEKTNRKATLKYMWKYKVRMFFGALIKITATLSELAIPYVLSYILDEVVPTKNTTKTIWLGVLMVAFAIIAFLANVIANSLAAGVAKLVTKELRHDTFSKIQTLSAAQLDDVTIPSLVSRMTSDTYNVHHMVGMVQRMGIRAPILLVGGIAITFTLDHIMTLVLVAILPLLVLITVSISKITIPLFTKVQTKVDKVVQTIRENASGVRVIKALSKGEYEKGRFAKVNKDLIDIELKSGYATARLSPITSAILNFGLVAVVVVGAYRVHSGIVLPGKVLAFTTYFTTILMAMLSVTRMFMIVTKALASAHRIDHVLNLPQDLLVEDIEKVETDYHIEFNNVSFSYNKKVNNVEGISFKVKKGESLGIIGPTGSGKSTLIQLLMRFYDVGSGEILIDGRNIKSIDKKELKSMFGVVFQNDTIFSNTIKENIIFGRNYSEEELIKACQIAQSYEFIQKQPNGFDTFLSAKGTNLSGGQKQRFLISRAIIGKPDILILDDASSALDFKTDANLRRAINENLADTTLIVVTQRVSSIMNCDHILVLDDGIEVGYGTHQELLNNVSVYKETYLIQMGGESHDE